MSKRNNKTTNVVVSNEKIDEKIVNIENETKKVSLLEKLRLYKNKNENVFFNEFVITNEVITILKNMNFVEKLKFFNVTLLSHIVDILTIIKNSLCIIEIHNELTNCTDETKLRSLLLNKYNLSKIENIREEKKKLLKMFESFLQYNEETKTYSISSFSEYCSNFYSIRKQRREMSKLFTIKYIIDNYFIFSEKCSTNYRQFYEMCKFNETYNFIRNMNVLSEMREILKETMTDDEKNIFSKESILFFNSSQFENVYNVNDNKDKRVLKKTYIENFEVFKSSEEFQEYYEKFNELSYLEQIEQIVLKQYNISNYNNLLKYMNLNSSNLIK